MIDENGGAVIGGIRTVQDKSINLSLNLSRQNLINSSKVFGTDQKGQLPSTPKMSHDIPVFDQVDDWDNHGGYDDHGAADYGSDHMAGTDSMPMDINNATTPIKPAQSSDSAAAVTAAAPVALVAAAQEKPAASNANYQYHKAFVMHDPYEVVGGSCPIKKGRSYQLPRTKKFQEQLADLLKDEPEHSYSSSDIYEQFHKSSERKPAAGLAFKALIPMLKLRQKFERRKRMQELRKNKGVSNLNNDEYFKSHPLFNDPDLISQQQAHENLIRKSPFTSLHSEMAEGKSLRSAHLQDVDDLIYATHDHDDGGGVYDDYYAGGNDNGADVGIVGNNNDANLADFNANRGQDDPVEFDMPVPTDDQFYDDEDDPEELARRVDAALSEDLFLLNKSNTYENICKKYVDGFHRSANEYMRYALHSFLFYAYAYI